MALLISESGSLDRNGPTATEVYLTSAATVWDEARAFLGGVQSIGGVLQYIVPAVHSSTGLICLSASPDINYQNEYHADTATLTVEYGIPDIDEDDETELASINAQVGGDMLQLERGEYDWTSGTKSGQTLADNTDVKPFKVVPQLVFSVTNNFKATLNAAALLNFYGKINNATFTPPGLSVGIPANQCRFDGADISRKITTDGYQFFQVTYNFTAAPHSWNTVWDGNQYSGVTPNIYQTTSFATIFSV